MQLLLINHSLYTGGVETLMVRMANWLVRNGHGCSILLRDSFEGDLTKLLDSKVNLRVVANQWDLLAVPGIGQLVWNRWDLPKPDAIYTLEQNWSTIGLLVRDLFPQSPPAVATGAYHINQFAYEDTPLKWGRMELFRQQIYDRHYRDSQKFFMSEETRIGHEAFFKRGLPDGWVWPLPIEIPSGESLSARKPAPYRILSIGRLTLFKTYSWYMVPILHSLREKYPDVCWHVYGFGGCERELVDDVWKDAIRDGLIVFHGPIANHAAVFIGMGTTLLEAAAAGVPCIPALVDDQESATWGFIDQMPYFTVGETVPGMEPGKKVEDLLHQIFLSSPAQVEAIQSSGRNYVDAYSSDRLMNRFLEHLNELERGHRLPLMLKVRYLWIRSLKLIRNLSLSFKRRGMEPVRHPGGDRLLH
jgi:glycosyltransferase involved in cell wall biosynthesis